MQDRILTEELVQQTEVGITGCGNFLKYIGFRFILNYPTHFHDHVTPKLGLTLQTQNCICMWDTISNVSANNEDFSYGAKKGLMDTPFCVWILWLGCKRPNKVSKRSYPNLSECTCAHSDRYFTLTYLHLVPYFSWRRLWIWYSISFVSAWDCFPH